MLLSRYLLIWLLFLASNSLSAQQLVVEAIDFPLAELSLEANQLADPAIQPPLQLLDFPSDSALLNALNSWVAHQREQAYWEASVDSLYQLDSLRWQAQLYRGPAYNWAVLQTDSVKRQWLRRAGYRARNFRRRALQQQDWEQLRDSLALQAARSGYPFARFGLTDVQWEAPGQLSAQLQQQLGPLITIGEVRLPETARVRTHFMEQYLGLLPGQPYDEGRIRRLPQLLRQLPYLRLRESPRISFQDQLAFVELPLERRPASRFDFVIGVLPNSLDGSLLITGELNGELQNSLGAGERIAVRFEQLRPRTQELEIELDYPYLLELPFEISLATELYRRDTQFLNLNWRAAAAYRWQADNRIEVFWSSQRTNLLGFDPQRVLSTGRLPDTLDVGRNLFGIKLQRQRLDRRFAPQSGILLEFSAGAGSRRIRRNGRLLELGVENLYDSLATRSTQYQLEGRLDLYRPGPLGTVLYTSLSGGAILGNNKIYPNEQYRLGGARQLRGFTEQEIFATNFLLATAEIRLPLGGQAYLYTFGDLAWVDGRSNAQPNIDFDYPLGFGAGINFETRAGVFAFSLALGKRNNERIDLGAPKAHFGYLSLF